MILCFMLYASDLVAHKWSLEKGVDKYFDVLIALGKVGAIKVRVLLYSFTKLLQQLVTIISNHITLINAQYRFP